MTEGSNGHASRQLRLKEELVQMARCLCNEGPNVNLVASILRLYKETVRYRYHHFFRAQGIQVQAMPSYSRLGFKRMVLVAKLAPYCEPNAKSIFNTLSESCYLHSFTRVLLRGVFVIHVAVPAELEQECEGVYRELRRAGLFTELEIFRFEGMRNPPMQPQFYDFVRGRWEIDWAKIQARETKVPLNVSPRVEKYDKADLLVLKELEIDAARTLAKMADNVKVNVSNLEFHYRDHVKSRGLIKGYRLVWQGTHYDSERQMTVSRKDLYTELTILLERGTRDEVEELMTLLNSTPFIWSEAHGRAYCAELFLPNQEYVPFLEYIDKFANKVGERLRIYVMDQSNAIRFVISYPLFDAESRRWQLDSDKVLRTLGRLAPMPRLTGSAKHENVHGLEK